MKSVKTLTALAIFLGLALGCSEAFAGPSTAIDTMEIRPSGVSELEVQTDFVFPKCGDGVINGQEECDEGDGGAWDVIGGSQNCGTGFSCAAPGTPDECKCYRNIDCGDGHITKGPGGSGEQCDPAADPTGCGTNEQCIQCQCITPWPSPCGDGTVNGQEECDFNASPTGCTGFNHCTNQCECKLWNVMTDPVCGDGTVEGSEECDGSATGCMKWPNMTAECTPSCTCSYKKPPYQLAMCGNGQLESGEECGEPGGPSGALIQCPPPQVCDNQCHCVTPAPECGNNIVESGETCDGTGIPTCIPAIGYTVSCNSLCECESVKNCGNGHVDSNEACDDGNTVDGDGCSSTCLIETSSGGQCNPNGLWDDQNEECDPQILKPAPGSCKGTDICNPSCKCEPLPPATCDPIDGVWTQGVEACDPGIGFPLPGSCPIGMHCSQQCKCVKDVVDPVCVHNGTLQYGETCDQGIPFGQPGSCAAGSTCNAQCKCEDADGCVPDGQHAVPTEECDLAGSGLAPGTPDYADAMVKQCEVESHLQLPPGAVWDVCEMSTCQCMKKMPQCVMGQPGVQCNQDPPGAQCPIPGSACSVNCQCLPPPSSGNDCGNGVVEAGEACDPPLTGICPAGICDANCQCASGGSPICGDGVVAIGQEECEPGKVFCLGQTVCDPADCLCKFPPLPSCGDGTVTPGVEQCDPAAFPTGCAPANLCNQSCHCVTSATFELCGNGLLSQGEECDFAAADPLATCTAGTNPTACAQDCTCTYETRPTIPTEPGDVETVVEAPRDDCFVYASSFSSDAAREVLDALNNGFRGATLRPDDRFVEPEQWATIYCRFSRAAAPEALLSEGLALELSGTALPDSSDNLRPYMFVLESGSKPLPIGEYATFEPVAEPLMILPLTDTPSAQFAKAAILPELSASPDLAQMTPFLPSSAAAAGDLLVINGVIEHQAYSVVPGQAYSIAVPGGSVQLQASESQGPAGTASVVHVMRMQLEPGGTPFTAVEGYEERKPIEELQIDAASDIAMLAARRQGEQPLTSGELSTDAWQRNLNYRGRFVQSQYVMKGEAMTPPEQRTFTVLGMMPMQMAQGSGCNCRLGLENRAEGMLAQFLIGGLVFAAALAGMRRRAKRKG